VTCVSALIDDEGVAVVDTVVEDGRGGCAVEGSCVVVEGAAAEEIDGGERTTTGMNGDFAQADGPPSWDRIQRALMAQSALLPQCLAIGGREFTLLLLGEAGSETSCW
jgi:hypothetical protein